MRSEKEVDTMIEEMSTRTKGKYITQGVSFNKTCPRQMGLLKKALMSSVSFSGLGKELLALKFDSGVSDSGINNSSQSLPSKSTKIKNVGNFL